jgi:hypothetical protein
VKEGGNSRAAVISELKLNGTAVFFVKEKTKKNIFFVARRREREEDRRNPGFVDDAARNA